MTAIQVTGQCRVRKKQNGQRIQMPVGFREGLAYRIVAGIFPNGSTDLHYLVINESGQTVPLRHDLVDILKEDQVRGDAQASHAVELSFPNPLREWCARTPRTQKPLDVIAYDSQGRKMIPHMVKRDADTQLLTVFWSRPVAGTLWLLWYEPQL